MATKVKLIADNAITTTQIDTSSLDSHFSGGTGVTYSSGEISIGQAVHSTDSPTFADLTLTGNLNITGDINSYNVTDLDVTDQTITLGAGQTEALSGGSGIIVDGSNASILWDETNNIWLTNKGLQVGDTSNNGFLEVKGDDPDIRQYINSASAYNLIEHKFIVDTTEKGRILYNKSNDQFVFEHQAASSTGKITIDAAGQTYIGNVDNAGFDGTSGLAIATNNPGISFKPQNSGWSGDDWLLYVNTDNDFFSVWNSTDGSDALKFYGTTNIVEATAEFRTPLLAAYTNTGRYAKYRSAYAQAATADFEIKSDNNSADVMNVTGTGTADVLRLKNDGTNQLVLDNNNSSSKTYMGSFSDAAYISTNYYYQGGHFSNDATKGSYEIYLGAGDYFGVNYNAPNSPGQRRRDLSIQGSTGYVGLGEQQPDAPLEIKNTPQMLLHLHRSASTPGIKFTNGGSTAGTYGFIIADEDEFNIGAYDGSTTTSWLQGVNNVVRVNSPISSLTDSGTRQYSHLCTGSFYSGTGAIIIETNIPAHNESGNANMFSLKIRGFVYDLYQGGQVDLNVGCYAGEGNYYNASYSATNMPSQWIDEIYFAKNDTTGKVAVILGTVTSSTNYEIAVTDFIQGFLNVNETYADGWSMTRVTSLSNYSGITACLPVNQSGRLGFHYYLSSSGAVSSGVNALALTSKLWERGNGYNNSTGRFTCRNNGAYLFTYALQLTTSTTNYTYISAEVRVNGGNRFVGGWFNSVNKGGNTAYDAATGSCVLDLVSGDYVDFYYELSASGTALGGPGYTFWSGVFLG